MKPMAGEIGTWLLGDKQVGGFKAWTVLISKQPSLCTTIKASGYWMFETPPMNNFLTRFYAMVENDIELIAEKQAIIKLPPNYPLDTFILSPIEITFIDNFDWRNL